MSVHTIIVPIHGEMANQAQFDTVLSFSLVVVVISNTAFGLLAYLLYNKHATAPITNAMVCHAAPALVSR